MVNCLYKLLSFLFQSLKKRSKRSIIEVERKIQEVLKGTKDSLRQCRFKFINKTYLNTLVWYLLRKMHVRTDHLKNQLVQGQCVQIHNINYSNSL